MTAAATSNEQLSTSRKTSQPTKSTRVLSCTRCHQRKLKCERKFPCSNCIASNSDCVPTPLLPRQRRRRFTERELLDRIRRYEDVLKQNDVAFEPLHPDRNDLPKTAGSIVSSPISTLTSDQSTNDQSHIASDNGTIYNDRDPNEDAGYLTITDEATLQDAMDQLGQDDNFLLFLAPSMGLDLSRLHPSPGHIFSLWQAYLDNVDPILKVTHAPTMHASIAETVNNPSAIDSNLEALLFGVYCVAILSLTETGCLKRFQTARSELLARYQIACREALLRCGFLRSRSRYCLTALYLYLISIKPYVDRRSLCMILGTTIRIARQIAIDKESTNTTHPPFEAEMRRRLWWSLVLFDVRVCESSHNLSCSSLATAWDCKMPSNLNDFEITPEIESLPESHDYPTEALHVVVRNKIAQHLRHKQFNLDSADLSPATTTQTAPSNEPASETTDPFSSLEQLLQRTDLAPLNLTTPLHFLTHWIAHSQLAKARLLHHYSLTTTHPQTITEPHRNNAMQSALGLLTSEAHLFHSPLTARFRWHFTHMPFLAYAHIIQDLKARPSQQVADEAWRVLSEDFANRFAEQPIEGHPIFKIFARSLVAAWEAREAGAEMMREEEPWVVKEMKRISTYGPLGCNGNMMETTNQEEFQQMSANFFEEGYLDPSTWVA